MKLIMVALISITPLIADAKPLWCEKLLSWAGLETSEVSLRLLEPRDISRVMEIADHQEVSEMVSRKGHGEFLTYMEDRLNLMTPMEPPFVIEFGGSVVGSLMFSRYIDFSKEFSKNRRDVWYEVGIMIEPKYWGLEIGQRAIQLAIEKAFSPALNSAGLVAFVKPENSRSLALLTKFGFVFHDRRQGVIVLVRRRNAHFLL